MGTKKRPSKRTRVAINDKTFQLGALIAVAAAVGYILITNYAHADGNLKVNAGSTWNIDTTENQIDFSGIVLESDGDPAVDSTISGSLNNPTQSQIEQVQQSGILEGDEAQYTWGDGPTSYSSPTGTYTSTPTSEPTSTMQNWY